MKSIQYDLMYTLHMIRKNALKILSTCDNLESFKELRKQEVEECLSLAYLKRKELKNLKL